MIVPLYVSNRTGTNLVKVDFSDLDAIAAFIREQKPDFLVHAAAQRFPDQVDKDPEAARKLNVKATESLAKCLGKN